MNPRDLEHIIKLLVHISCEASQSGVFPRVKVVNSIVKGLAQVGEICLFVFGSGGREMKSKKQAGKDSR
jgi:hypothetical protein